MTGGDDGGAPARAEQVSSICQECGAPVDFPPGAQQVRCDHCQAGFAVAAGSRLVRLGCPCCGGNFYYLDGSMAGDCPYCQARLLAVSERQVLRYVVRPLVAAPEDCPDAELTLLPFWQMGALMYAWYFACRAHDANARTKIEKRFAGRVIDLSLADPAAVARGVFSLRSRGAVFPQEPFAEEHEGLGALVRETLTIPEAADLLFTRAIGTTRPTGDLGQVRCQRLELAAESLGLIYYPFWLSPGQPPRAWDAVSGEPERLGGTSTPPAGTASDLFDALRVLELACEACGAPLVAGNRAVVLPCSGCECFWRVTPEGLQRFTARYASPRLSGESICWLPFWRVALELTYKATRLERAAQIETLLGVPLLDRLPLAAPDAPPCYFAPAFGNLRAPRVEHAARDLTRLQLPLQPGPPPASGSAELFHCFFSEQDARALAYPTLMALLPSISLQELRTLRVKSGAAELWYLPFDRRGRELVNLVTGGAYDLATFSGVRH
jgi:LSD1 subclass zinc finger protein